MNIRNGKWIYYRINHNALRVVLWILIHKLYFIHFASYINLNCIQTLAIRSTGIYGWCIVTQLAILRGRTVCVCVCACACACACVCVCVWEREREGEKDGGRKRRRLISFCYSIVFILLIYYLVKCILTLFCKERFMCNKKLQIISLESLSQ